MRKFARFRVRNARLPVFHADNRSINGVVHDVSEDGVCISGIPANPGDWVTLTIAAEDVYGIDSIVFDAECRWAKPEEPGRPCFTGYEITAIAEEDHANLARLIQFVRTENESA